METVDLVMAVALVAAGGVAAYALREVIKLKKALLGEMQRALELDITKAYVDLRERSGP